MRRKSKSGSHSMTSSFLSFFSSLVSCRLYFSLANEEISLSYFLLPLTILPCIFHRCYNRALLDSHWSFIGLDDPESRGNQLDSIRPFALEWSQCSIISCSLENKKIERHSLLHWSRCATERRRSCWLQHLVLNMSIPFDECSLSLFIITGESQLTMPWERDLVRRQIDNFLPNDSHDHVCYG